MKVESLVSIINRTIEGLYYSSLLNERSIKGANKKIEQFLIDKQNSNDKIFVENGLDKNVDLYKKLSIIYLCVKVYISEIHNRDSKLPSDKLSSIYDFLDHSTPKALLVKFNNDEKFRSVIVENGILLICGQNDINSYKQICSLINMNKVKQVMTMMPYYLMEYVNQAEVDTQDLIIDDVIETYVANLKKIENENEEENGVLEKEGPLSLDDMSEAEREALKLELSEYDEEINDQVEDIMYEMLESIKDIIIDRYEDNDFDKKIGFIIGSAYSCLVRQTKLDELQQKLLTYLENPNVNLEVAIEQFVSNDHFSHAILETFISDSMFNSKEIRMFKERQIEIMGQSYVKTLRKFDTYYKGN